MGGLSAAQQSSSPPRRQSLFVCFLLGGSRFGIPLLFGFWGEENLITRGGVNPLTLLQLVYEHFKATVAAVKGVHASGKYLGKIEQMMQTVCKKLSSKNPKEVKEGREMMQKMIEYARSNKSYRYVLMKWFNATDSQIGANGKYRPLYTTGRKEMKQLYNMSLANAPWWVKLFSSGLRTPEPK